MAGYVELGLANGKGAPASDFAILADYIATHDDPCDDNLDHYHLGYPGADGRGLTAPPLPGFGRHCVDLPNCTTSDAKPSGARAILPWAPQMR